MLLSEVKELLKGMDNVVFRLQDGTEVPAHFHVTEVGSVKRHFIDCGGTMRDDAFINFQLWTAADYDHRLAASKLLNIITLSEDKLGLADAEVRVEYQTETIGVYGIGFENNAFVLYNTQTDCLAKDACGIPEEKWTITAQPEQGCCSPSSGCC